MLDEVSTDPFWYLIYGNPGLALIFGKVQVSGDVDIKHGLRKANKSRQIVVNWIINPHLGFFEMMEICRKVVKVVNRDFRNDCLL